MEDKYIYYVTAIDVDEITEEMLQKEYKIHLLKYDRQIDYEKFLKFKKDWHEDKYNISSFISSYHLEKEEAIEYAKKNIGDINESGSYPYAAVVSAPIGYSYYNTCQNKEENFIFYKYNHSTKKYEEIDKENEVYNYLLEHVWGMISMGGGKNEN